MSDFESWESIHKVIEHCRDLGEITISNYSFRLSLKNSVIVEIASLPRLESLDLNNCLIDGGCVSPLARCKGLRHLSGDNFMLSSEVLRAIGCNLLTLQCKLGSGGLVEIVTYCLSLVDLDIWFEDEDSEDSLCAEGLIKSAIMKFSKLVINERVVRLGTDWEG
jgi:hypothetical protein